MVELRQLAITDLNFGYSRNMGGNKLRHYKVPYIAIAIANSLEVTPESILRQYLKDEEGLEEVKIIPAPSNVVVESDGTAKGNVFAVKEISDALLEKDQDILKVLKSNPVQSLLYQYNDDPTPLRSKYLTPITRTINKLIDKINNFLYRFQKDASLTFEDLSKNEYRDWYSGLYRIPRLPEYGYVRRVSPVRFLTVGFEETDLEEASKSLLADLRLLKDKELILGTLAPPSIILLADTVGSGKLSYAMFCFVACDGEKLCKLTGRSYLELPHKALELIGVKNETLEGSINWLNGKDPISKYDIEEIVIQPVSAKARREYENNYLETREQIDGIVKKAAQIAASVEVVNKQSFQGDKQIMVKADFIDKNTGEGKTLEEIYRENKDRE